MEQKITVGDGENAVSISIPEGFEIDTENSTFTNIKFKPIKYITMRSVYKNVIYPVTGFGGEDDDIVFTQRDASLHGWLASDIVAYAALSDIARHYNNGWEPNWNDSKEEKYRIVYYSSKDQYVIKQNFDFNNGMVVFKSEADAQAVIDNPNFREILDVLFKHNNTD